MFPATSGRAQADFRSRETAARAHRRVGSQQRLLARRGRNLSHACLHSDCLLGDGGQAQTKRSTPYSSEHSFLLDEHAFALAFTPGIGQRRKARSQQEPKIWFAEGPKVASSSCDFLCCAWSFPPGFLAGIQLQPPRKWAHLAPIAQET